MTGYWIINIVLLSIGSFFIYKKTGIPGTRRWFFPGLLVKLTAGLAVGCLYFYYYRTGDTIRFHLAASEVYHQGMENPGTYISFLFSGNDQSSTAIQLGFAGEPRSLFFIKMISLIDFMTGGSYWINSLYFSWISFLGGWMLITRTAALWPTAFYPVLVSFIFFPSSVFWSSGILKESLSFACFGMIASIFLEFYARRRIRFLSLAVFLISGWIYWEIKYNSMIILMISMITILIADRFHAEIPGWKSFSLTAGIFILVSVLGSFIHPNFHLDRLLSVLQENHQLMIRISDRRNLIPFIHDSHPVSGFLLNLPLSLFGGLFMPLPFQGKSPIALAPGFMNLMVLFLALVVLFRKIKFPVGRERILVYGIILYIITLAVMLAYSSPNFGTLERYKISYLPLFLSLILSANRDWIFRAGKKAGFQYKI